MKNFIAKLSITAITIIGIVALVTLSAHAGRTIGRHQNADFSQTDIRPEIPGHCYGEVMNNLFGR
jgi:hypothetical protein